MELQPLVLGLGATWTQDWRHAVASLPRSFQHQQHRNAA
eukprot:CAMPEP_0183553736 /NCGR_PEP_ID=MMETSP0371-20130417/75726_1 /TAXON_ID=268820 /ORGANISM="Peridinium aciculiferum, Strain PAER-2" /LENGTH=38 /DNA_ID= /DNA_START= /DNA_END= /DNA_ORIENTATION=